MNHHAKRLLDDYFNQYPDEKAISTATENDLSQIVAVIGRPLPSEYLNFLTSFGCAVIADKIILGVSSAPGMYGVNASLVDYFRESAGEIPWIDQDDYLIFSFDDIGNNYAFDSFGCVFFCDHEEKNVVKAFEGFSDWVIRCALGDKAQR